MSPLFPAVEKFPVGICQAYVSFLEYTCNLQFFQPLVSRNSLNLPLKALVLFEHNK